MENLLKALKNTDWDMLQQQKLELLRLTGGRHGGSPILEGLVNFLDAIQDAAVDDGIASKETVFGAHFDPEPSLMLVLPLETDQDDPDTPEECRLTLTENDVAWLIRSSMNIGKEGVVNELRLDANAEFCDADDSNQHIVDAEYSVRPPADIQVAQLKGLMGQDPDDRLVCNPIVQPDNTVKCAVIYVEGLAINSWNSNIHSGPFYIPVSFRDDPANAMAYLRRAHEHVDLREAPQTKERG